jgi:hypothetical protein
MDPQQTQQYAGMIAGMMGVFAIISSGAFSPRPVFRGRFHCWC